MPYYFLFFALFLFITNIQSQPSIKELKASALLGLIKMKSTKLSGRCKFGCNIQCDVVMHTAMLHNVCSKCQPFVFCEDKNNLLMHFNKYHATSNTKIIYRINKSIKK